LIRFFRAKVGKEPTLHWDSSTGTVRTPITLETSSVRTVSEITVVRARVTVALPESLPGDSPRTSFPATTTVTSVVRLSGSSTSHEIVVVPNGLTCGGLAEKLMI
jgi:hypothetical protein